MANLDNKPNKKPAYENKFFSTLLVFLYRHALYDR